VAAGFLENIQAKVGPYDHGPERSRRCVPAATWQLMMAAQAATPALRREQKKRAKIPAVQNSYLPSTSGCRTRNPVRFAA
jgi:hypothetical protein